MATWVSRLEGILAHLGHASPAVDIHSLVDLALEQEDAGEAHLNHNRMLMDYAPQLSTIYQAYILDMERRASDQLLAQGRSQSFIDTADESARQSYLRVDDLFECIDFTLIRHFTMVGCGRFPVTALQAAERFPDLTLTALDIEPEAITACRHLATNLKMHNLSFLCANGMQHNYQDSEVIFIANMVTPKSETLRRVLDTAPTKARVILREPYGLGRLWAERCEDTMDQRVQVTARGKGSRFLSRNVFIASVS